jgi:hypothetical protein
MARKDSFNMFLVSFKCAILVLEFLKLKMIHMNRPLAENVKFWQLGIHFANILSAAFTYESFVQSFFEPIF